MKSAYDKIAAGLEDAIAFTGGDKARGREQTADRPIGAKSGSFSRAAARRAFERVEW